MTASLHTIRATLNDGTELSVIESSLTLDESWAPYAQGDLTIVTPADLSTINARGDVRINLAWMARYGGLAFVFDWTAAYSGRTVDTLTAAWSNAPVSSISNAPARSYGGQPVVTSSSRTANLGLRSRRVNTDGTTALTVASDEALLQDLKITDYPGPLINFTLRDFITHTLPQGLNSLHQFTLEPGLSDAPMPVGASSYDPLTPYQFLQLGKSWWDTYTPYLQASNLRLWCDERGKLYLTPRDFTLPGTMAMRSGVNLTEASDLIDRDSDEWADSLVMSWTWKDDAGIQNTAYSVWPVENANPSKTMVIETTAVAPFSSGTPYDQRPAALLYPRILARGHQIPAQAISDYSATPGMTALVEFPGTPAQSGYLQSVTWSSPADEMTVTARNLA